MQGRCGVRTRLWWLMHNCIAHPIEGVTFLFLGRCPRWAVRFHEWTIPESK